MTEQPTAPEPADLRSRVRAALKRDEDTMRHPVDVLAEAMRTADGNHTMGTGRLAEVVAKALLDPRVVENAVNALLVDGWRETHEGPGGVGTLSDEDLTNIACTVLRSVAEPSVY